MTQPRIVVIGGGLMGIGIAQVFAGAGHRVCVVEPIDAARTTAIDRVRENLVREGAAPGAADHIETSADLGSAVAAASYVTEAVPEKLELKRAIFAELVAKAPRTAILASNTSVIPIGRIAEGLDTADRIVGTHWWNPAPLIPLVEVVQSHVTSDATVAATMKLLQSIGKKPAHVQKDLPGFVANRLQHALWREAIAMVAEGICDARTLDDCVKNSFGLRLAVLGPLENADLVGLDLTLDIHKTIIPELDRHDRPNEMLEKCVAAGRLGFKSGQGFRAWTTEEMAALRSRLTNHLLEAQRQRIS
ncbi:MAG TPA: 3-hydroxyacyl-CoA dehydrogenase NAD-binding domain-containing protein [Steroidobacteraceae bacterium]|jgi:3-hydroxybutyryl-CoA dehydrogenase|nr:3-hydroxyacyl-CoA dehydrogenase NAD-binding domain-containing protein [Steroidobacteraceae bacterium]